MERENPKNEGQTPEHDQLNVRPDEKAASGSWLKTPKIKVRIPLCALQNVPLTQRRFKNKGLTPKMTHSLRGPCARTVQ